MWIQETNSNLKRRTSLPNSLKSANIIGGFHKLSELELNSYGFFALDIPNYNAITHELGAYTKTGNQYTQQITAKILDLDTIKAEKLTYLDSLRDEIINSVKGYLEEVRSKGQTVPQTSKNLLNKVYDKVDEYRTIIGNATDAAVLAVWEIPETTIVNYKQQLKKLTAQQR
jgi:hypothetical protein